MNRKNMETELMKDEILRLRKRISRLKWGINGSIEYLNKVVTCPGQTGPGLMV